MDILLASTVSQCTTERQRSIYLWVFCWPAQCLLSPHAPVQVGSDGEMCHAQYGQGATALALLKSPQNLVSATHKIDLYLK